MKPIWTMLLVSGTLGGADVSLWTSGEAIVENMVMARARGEAVSMFDAVGVHLEWTRAHPTGCPANPIEVRFSSGNLAWPRGSLAYSTPFAAQPVITVFYDRVKSTSPPEFRWRLLAHVLVHEIAHVLMRTDHHNSEGIMKAHWTTSDFIQMAHDPLPFGSMDKDIIRNGLRSLEEARASCHATFSHALDDSKSQGGPNPRIWNAHGWPNASVSSETLFGW